MTTARHPPSQVLGVAERQLADDAGRAILRRGAGGEIDLVVDPAMKVEYLAIPGRVQGVRGRAGLLAIAVAVEPQCQRVAGRDGQWGGAMSSVLMSTGMWRCPCRGCWTAVPM